MYRFVKESAPPTIYTPIAQAADPLPATVNLSVRAQETSPAGLSREIAGTIAAVDRDISLTLRTLSDQVGAQYAQERLVAGVATVFGALALLLAGLGLYGVTASSVAQRRFEIGVRMALGATPAGILRLFLARVGRLIAGGIALGLIGGLWTAKAIKSMRYGVEPRDMFPFAAACTLLIAVATLAVWLPGRRAARTDPANVLREG